MKTLCPNIVSIVSLRKDLPNWTWRAVRDGFGWVYEGTFTGISFVHVHPVAVVSGPAEDDYSTVWVVDTGNKRSVPLALWVRRESNSDQ